MSIIIITYNYRIFYIVHILYKFYLYTIAFLLGGRNIQVRNNHEKT